MIGVGDFTTMFSPILKYKKDMEKQTKALNMLFPDQFITTSWGRDTLVCSYITLLSKYVEDKAEWIDWYVWENDCGKKAYEVAWRDANTSKQIRVHVKNLKDLLYVIQYDARKFEKRMNQI